MLLAAVAAAVPGSVTSACMCNSLPSLPCHCIHLNTSTSPCLQVSTNIAETSLTVDGIIYVVDTGWVPLVPLVLLVKNGRCCWYCMMLQQRHGRLSPRLQQRVGAALSAGWRCVHPPATGDPQTLCASPPPSLVFGLPACRYVKMKVYNPKMGMDALQVGVGPRWCVCVCVFYLCVF